MFYREWTRNVASRKGVMVPVEVINSSISQSYDPGYASVYLFDQESAQAIKQSQSSKNMDRYPVAADALPIDIDNGEEGLLKTLNILDRQGLAYSVWSSGGKGYHIFVPHELTFSQNLPYTHRCIVEELGIDTDLSLYQHGRLLSLPGRVHPVTKNRKTFLYKKEGQLLTIILRTRPPRTFQNVEVTDGDILSVGLFQLNKLILQPPNVGNRHIRLWSVANNLIDAGLTPETILDILTKVNSLWPEPKPIEDLEKILQRLSTNKLVS